MSQRLNLFATQVRLLRSRATRHAYVGMAIALAAVFVATGITAWLQSGEIGLQALLDAQRSNASLWLLDLMPFAFAFWGQYVSVLLAHEAGAMVLDATENLRARNAALEVAADRQNTHDPLTELPNRGLFLDRLEQAIEQSHREQARVGVVVLNLDGFKEVNDALGQHNGDRVLKSVARRLRSAVPESSTVARLFGDTFAVLLPRVEGREDLVRTARRISKGLEPPCALENLTLNLQASSGGAVCPDDAVDGDTLMNCADSAMHQAKSKGGLFVLYRARDRRADPETVSLTAELQTALQQGQLGLHYQPVVECAGDRVIGAEALVRWEHPRRGMILPQEFIPRAERSGLILEVSRWVLQRALEEARQLRQAGWPLRVSVNVSERSLLDPEFPDMLAGLLAATEVPADSLMLEINEDTLMADRRRAHDIVARIGDMGVRIALDDFGTGYSQLSHLKRLPISEIKIDRGFVHDMLQSDADLAIVRAAIDMGHALGLKVVGEGVEDENQEQKLAEMGCDCIQGHYVSRTLTIDQLPGWLEEWHGGWHAEPSPDGSGSPGWAG
ncbi:signal transduction family protein (GGDEF domain-containing protein) [Salinisphaera sp. PC39]|uniref:putative bifunctional diguanylate cyclase/phosphodiesterase n=1 Tax=Salinisphaera sp. PC39 TaxID=1304156 RepID=UPI0033415B7A